jgi:hypothetical protein
MLIPQPSAVAALSPAEGQGDKAMSKIVRREFVGSKWLFFLLCLFGITFPFAIIYLLEATVTIEDDMEDPEKFMDALRLGKVGRK